MTCATDCQLRNTLLITWATSQGGAVMFIFDSEAIDPAESNRGILTFDVSDDALEHAAASDGQAVHTIGYCTHWYHCNWPL